jgi:hypothetical protein
MLEGEPPLAPRDALKQVADAAGGGAALLGAIEIAAGIETRAERLA